MPTLKSPGPQRLLRRTPVVRPKCLLRSIGTSAMGNHGSPTSVEAAVPAAKHFTAGDTPATTAPQATRLREASSWQARPFGYRSRQALPLLRKRFRGQGGFTLVELLVSIGVLAVLVLLATQLLNSAAT